MGLASSIGLGLALARPDVRVFVLDGDGSLLMNLGSLATIGLLHPPNLVVIVMDNEEYATTGGQPTPTAYGADLDAAARAMRVDATTVRTVPSSRLLSRDRDPGRGRESHRVGADRKAAARLRRDQGSLHDRPRRGARVTLGRFAVEAAPPAAARHAAARAVLDTIGVALAGASNPPRAAVQRVVTDSHGPCTILGLAARASDGDAALANGTAAHALDYDDMCFVSLAHPSAPLVAAALAAAERPARRAARSSTPTSSASRSKRGWDAR